MITFKKLRIKNFKSFGNSWNEIDYSGNRLVAVIGKNGQGKCLDKNTVITIRRDDDQTPADTTLIELYDFLLRNPHRLGHIEVLTQYGYKTIEACDYTAYDSEVYQLVTSANKEVFTSPDHLLYIHDRGWEAVKNIHVGDIIDTIDGPEKVVSCSLVPDLRDDLMDLQVADVHEFYANGVVSHNSACMTDALCFALYGKTISNTPRGKLVNSINGKGLVVECEFETNGHDYKVVRGLKPSIFQIYQDGKLINEESNVRDYQQVLEEQILKVHIKNFMQTILISTANYVPFMEMGASDRRSIIENILGVSVLTDMNVLLKEKAQLNNEQLTSVHYDIENIKIQLESDKHVVNTLKQAKERNLEQINQQIESLSEQLCVHNANIEKINANIQKITPVVNQYGSLKNAQRELLQKQGEVKSTLSKLLKDSKFVQSHDYCPICKQNIEQSHKDKIVEQTNEQQQQVEQTLAILQQQMDDLNSKEAKFLELIEKYNQLNQQLSEQNTAVYMLNNQIAGLNQQLVKPNNEAEIEQRTQAAWEKASKAKDLLSMKNELLQYKSILDQASVLLRDSGIKTAVINQYLPTINQMINKYLSDMDFYLSFELDEKFNETIKARYRDEYTYQNLSQGERRRLDIAIILTWRYIAEIRNSCSCNIMIIDELIDSALDGEGVDSIMKLLKKMTEGSIFVISHRESVQDIGFDKAIYIEKDGQFSSIREVSM